MWTTTERGSLRCFRLSQEASTVTVVNLAAVLERADEQVLPSVYAFVALSFKSSPATLGLLTLSRSLAEALASPAGGVAGHLLHRGKVIGVGCLLWATCAGLFALTSSAAAAFPLWALGGVGLALIIPSCQSLIADLHQDAGRGRAFGTMHLAASAGGMLGALVATNMAAQRFGGMDGWRMAFLLIAMLSAAAGVANLAVTHDPRFPASPPPNGPPGSPRQTETGSCSEHAARASQASSLLEAPVAGSRTMRALLSTLRRELQAVLRIPTFGLIVAQGIFGSIPWAALVFLTLYLQLCGMSAAAASALVATFLCSYAVGGLLGGMIGDAAAKRWPRHGRICVAQFSVATGIPFALLLIKGLPRDGRPGTILLYALLLSAFALLKAWPSPACNNPIFATIVPIANRTLVYAFDRGFETALAAGAAPLVGVLAQQVFGFRGTAAPTGSRQRDLANADALGNALLAFMLLPWLACFGIYSALHWTYAKDRAAAAAAKVLPAEVQLSPSLSSSDAGGEQRGLLAGG